MPTQSLHGQKATVSRSTVHELLSSATRRAVVDELDAHAPLSQSALAERIVTRHDAAHDNADDVAAMLHHNHLPKLADHGVVVETDGGYRLGPNAGALLSQLDYSEALGGVRGNFRVVQ